MAGSELELIVADKANTPGPYSHAVIYADTAYVSSQTGMPPAGEDPGSVGLQTTRAFDSIREILIASGTELSEVIKVNVYLADMGAFAEMNDAYLEVFGDHRPARTTIHVNEYPGGYKVAFDVVAAVS
jgi:2-iminobutanoate/2-iminopropanoate deaminase